MYIINDDIILLKFVIHIIQLIIVYLYDIFACLRTNGSKNQHSPPLAVALRLVMCPFNITIYIMHSCVPVHFSIRFKEPPN